MDLHKKFCYCVGINAFVCTIIIAVCIIIVHPHCHSNTKTSDCTHAMETMGIIIGVWGILALIVNLVILWRCFQAPPNRIQKHQRTTAYPLYQAGVQTF